MNLFREIDTMLRGYYRYLIGGLVIALFSVVMVVNAMPVLQNSSQTIRQLADKNHFYFGAAVSPTHFGDPKYMDTLKNEFNMLTPENEAKFCSLQAQQGQFDFRSLDRLMDFAAQNQMTVRGHNLVWHQCLPGWIANGEFSREEAIKLLHDHIYTVVGRYKGRIPMWDVANETINDSGTGLRDTPWRKLIGDDYVELAFKFAHEADPDALLFYNDFNTEQMNTKSNAVYEMVKDFVARGVPINGVGLQAHYTVGQIDAAGVAENMKRLGELGLQVQITEMDDRYPENSSDTILQQQAGDYRTLLQTCLDSEYCTAFVTWGVNDLYSWLRDSNLGFYENQTVKPLLFDDNYQPKPAYYAVLDTLARHAGEAPILSDAEIEAMSAPVQPTVAEVKLPPIHKTDLAQLSPDPVPGAAYYAPFPVTIQLDGKTDDWANIPRVTVDKGPMLPADNTTSMQFAVAADATNIYFLAEVKDSKLVYGKHDLATEWYKEDSVEFYLNTTGDFGLTSYKPGVVQITIPAANIDNSDAPKIGGSNSGDVAVDAVVVKTDEGYTVEASVPLVTDVWKMVPLTLGKVGFQVHLNGASSDDDRDTKLIWSVYDTQDQSYTNPSLFGQLIFWRAKKAN
jgi:GH35 family endo-1,4-beta-xylanase